MAEKPGGEATEEPTPRRLRQARERGQIASSGDFTSAAGFVAAVAALAAGGAALAGELERMVRRGLERAVSEQAAPAAALGDAWRELLRLSAPVVGVAFLAALIVGALQAGGLFTLQPLAPKGERLDPLAGAGRIFSKERALELVKALVKLAIVVGVAWATLEPRVGDVPRLVGARAAVAAGWTWALVMKLVVRVAVAYALIGVADYLWQRRRHLRELRMTREEVKREHKEDEGDPKHKAERMRLHREILRHAMVEAVRSADVVIVNPEHIAVAIRYDQETMGAPEVVAKGEDLVAQQIKEVARAHGVPVYRDVALARALNEMELGEQIPEALYDAVAEVLRFVYEQEVDA